MGSSSRKRSSRKKSSKLSSQARKMKKSRGNKSKKLRRRHDSMSSDSISSPGNYSYSSNSDDDSMSSASSSEDTYRRRRRKDVLRSRGNVKKTRKRARRRSSSRESREELARMKKRKRSKKDSDSKLRKKSRRKKPRREASISSASSDSRSCSTCNDGSNSGSEESEHERVRSRSVEKTRVERDSRKDKLRTKMSNPGSPSHSSYSRFRDESVSVSHSEEKFLSENNSRRLKSVIIFAERPSQEEGNKWEKHLQKEEIVYDHDDYPSRSSSGGGSKKESTSRSPVGFDAEKWTESAKVVSDHEVAEPSGSVNDAHGQYVSDPFLNDIETHSSMKESRKNIPLTDTGSEGDDLEAILRQKALKNFKKFRGGPKNHIEPTADQKNMDEGNVNPSSTSLAEVAQSRLPKPATLAEVERDVSDGGHSRTVSGIAKEKTNHSPDGLALSGNPEKEGNSTGHPVVGKSVTGNSSFRGRSSGLDTLNQTTTSGASPDKNLLETERSERKITTSVETSTSVTGNSSFGRRSSVLDTLNQSTTSVSSLDKNLMETERSEKKTELNMTQSISPRIGINKDTASSSATIEPTSGTTSGGQSLNNQKDEAKDGAQYQQKTMSVMRGGEMVQVNYKVYIPQRARALARRQLKR